MDRLLLDPHLLVFIFYFFFVIIHLLFNRVNLKGEHCFVTRNVVRKCWFVVDFLKVKR